jgi:signal transduction histidine kinase/ActR/RegA family two-component response regulator
MARTLAASLALRDGDLRRFHAEASAATRDSEDWVFLVDRERQLLNTLRPYDPAQSLPRAPGAPLVGPQPQFFFTPHGPLLGKPVIGVFVAEAGVSPPRFNVGVSFPLSALQSLLDANSFPDGSVAAVIDRDQFVMARSRDPARWVGVQATGELKRRAQIGETGIAPSVTLDGVPSITYLSRPDRYGFSVVIALPQTALSGAARRLTFQAMAASAALLGLGLGLALYAARRISTPVGALRRAALQLGQEAIPPVLSTGVSEADEVSAALHIAGQRIREATATLEHRVAEAVRQAQDAQARLLTAQKHEAIGRLSGGIAHDFNNLLQTISTAHHVLDRSVTSGPQRRVLDAAMRATAKAADLIRQMLAFGRAQPLHAQPVDLGDFVLKSQELTSKALGQRVTLTARIAPGLPPLLVDPTQLELALLNLIFNARDAMPGGGEVRIEGRLALPDECTALGEGRFVCVEVSDNGAGMDAATLAQAFDPYFTTKPIGSGSGIGLSQVLAFARQSGGDARLHSTPGVGTRASLFLPTCERQAAGGEAAPAGTPVLRPLRILMVEDDVLVVSVVKPALEGLGHQVTLCSTADDAVELLSRPQDVDVLFTDVVMPGSMTGLDLVEWCDAHRPGLPCVVVSGYTAQPLGRPLKMLRKPYGVAELVAALAQAVEQGAAALEGESQGGAG